VKRCASALIESKLVEATFVESMPVEITHITVKSMKEIRNDNRGEKNSEKKGK
jgi:hypothetical protein